MSTKRFLLGSYILAVGLFFIMSPRIHPATIFLTSDRQIRELQNPDYKLDLSIGFEKRFMSLREVCEDASKRGDHTLTIAFDYFFAQYRGQAGTVRRLKPDEDEYIHIMKKVSRFAAHYGMGLRLSILSPLEIGPGFIRETGESGRWVQFKVGYRDPQTGKFSVQLWRQLYWTNNKGRIRLKLKGVKAYAFKEKVIDNGHYSVVNPNDIKEIKSGVKIDKWSIVDTLTWEPSDHDILQPIQRVRIYSNGDNELKGDDRILVLLEYETPEMDYFSPEAEPFLESLIKKYHDEGINLVSIYSDEPHIQQDWYYFNHQDNGEFSMLYLTKNTAKTYCRLYDPSIHDMDKYMLYFVYGPKIYTNSSKALIKTQYVMGDTPSDIYRTILFRDRYYKLLNDHVVDIFEEAKRYAEKLFGRKFPIENHATWAESPTIDLWDTGDLNGYPYQYEYTSNFLWSNTVQQAAAACYDYFKWGEFLSPTGDDYAEGGWADRDYFGEAMAVSLGIINRYPNAYAAFWGMPDACARRKQAVVDAFGLLNSSSTIKAITGGLPRNVSVLMLYPMNLVAADPRFGSWITQYGYADYITDEKLLQVARVTPDGKIEMGGRTFSTLVALFEPVPQKGILHFMNEFSERGGRVIWFGPPPLINGTGEHCIESWENLFGVDYKSTPYLGQIASGQEVVFKNRFKRIPAQVILTGFLVDHVYPIRPRLGTQILSRVGLERWIVGTEKQNVNGQTFFFGFRPRDDQSKSLGYETKTLFDILDLAGAYPSTGIFPNINDNTEYVSRTTPYLATRFPNGTTVIASQYCTQPEDWLGGFSRNDSVDALALKKDPLPSDTLRLRNFKVNGHEISFNGSLICAFNEDSKGNLISFEGHNCDEVTVDGRTYHFANEKFSMISWAQVSNSEKIDYHAFMKVFIKGNGRITLPVEVKCSEIRFSRIVEGKIHYLNLTDVKLNPGSVSFTATPRLSGKWIYLSN